MAGRIAVELQQKGIASVEQEIVLNIMRTAQQLQNRTNELLREYGLTVTQYNVLRILRGAQPLGLACSEIAERMIADDPDITRLLDRMVSGGLVFRERSTEDRRVVISKITTEAMELLSQIDQPLQQQLGRVFETLDHRAMDQLISSLEEIRQKLS